MPIFIMDTKGLIGDRYNRCICFIKRHRFYILLLVACTICPALTMIPFHLELKEVSATFRKSNAGGPFTALRGTRSGGAQCNALILSSGGARGVYQAGVLRSLTTKLHADDVKWHIVSGVSVGAINALSSLFFEVGQEKRWSDSLVELWATLKQHNIYQQWTFREVEGLLMKSGLYDNSPLGPFLNSTIAKFTNGTFEFQSDRKLIVSATDLGDGLSKEWTEKANATALIDAVIASSSIPGVFPIKKIGDSEYVDGGVLESINIVSAIERCKTEVGVQDDSEINVDIISCNPFAMDKASVMFSKEHSINILLRANYVSMCENTKQMLLDARMMYPKVNFRYLISPKETLPNIGLDFDHHNLMEMMHAGERDGSSAIERMHGSTQRHAYIF